DRAGRGEAPLSAVCGRGRPRAALHLRPAVRRGAGSPALPGERSHHARRGLGSAAHGRGLGVVRPGLREDRRGGLERLRESARPRLPGARPVRRYRPTNSNSALLNASACEAFKPCGPPLMSASWLPLIASWARFPLASNGTIASESPWMIN